MRIFSSLYSRALVWSRHRHAPWYLGGLSFAESSFFPIPPDVMLAPMSMVNPGRSWAFAGLTTIASVVGGLLGYLIGTFAFELVAPLLEAGGYWEQYQAVQVWFARWGFWAVFLAGFSPIPYKIFTITAGVIAMPLLPFVLASLVGRGMRFFLVAGLMAWGGERMERMLHVYVDRIGWITVSLVAAVFVVHRVGAMPG
ncbi:putative membrane protein [Thioflavicoccus mobilis 8321]|uniref:Putative membrane protein n=1 Tax=Thioflavicoccus mobilis 8321 TaxID=765912 RepID=L0GVW6_9GAMM|nr:YqaA family protein [Thioflavicoccus mobilis]AGA90126.1 putative membrane protein [Thioflavicoccus mobilis 8321]